MSHFVSFHLVDCFGPLRIWCDWQVQSEAQHLERHLHIAVFSSRFTASRWSALAANLGGRSNKSGDFKDQREELSSGYRGGVKIDLDFTFIAQCARSMFPFIVFFHGILHPLMQMWNRFRSFLTLFLHLFALDERFRAWLPLGDQGVSQLSSGDFWPKIHPIFCLRHRFSLLTSDDSGHHPKMCLGLNWQQSISRRCGMFRKNWFETLVN